MEDKAMQSQGVGEKLLNYVSENPFITIWNLILFLGGIFLLIFFSHIHYLPQADLASLTGVLASVALVGLMLLVALIGLPVLPGLYFRYVMELEVTETKYFWGCLCLSTGLGLLIVSWATTWQPMELIEYLFAVTFICCAIYLLRQVIRVDQRCVMKRNQKPWNVFSKQSWE